MRFAVDIKGSQRVYTFAFVGPWVMAKETSQSNNVMELTEDIHAAQRVNFFYLLCVYSCSFHN